MFMHDPPHQFRGQRNVAAGYFLVRDGERFCLSFIQVLRCCSNPVIVNQLIAHCSETAMIGRDKHSQDLATIAFREEIEAVLRQAGCVTQTLLPDRYRPWLQKCDVKPKNPTFVTSSRNGNLWLSSDTFLSRVVLTFPVTCTTVAGATTEGQTKFPRGGTVRLRSVRFEQLGGTCVVSDLPSRLELVAVDQKARTFTTLHIQMRVRVLVLIVIEWLWQCCADSVFFSYRETQLELGCAFASHKSS
jgi:hypothetical protein